MESEIRSACLLRFKDGSYMGHHKKPGAALKDKWLHGRRVGFQQAKVYPNRRSAINATRYIYEPVEIVEVYITEPVQLTAPKVLENV